jgi:hypothetical protein
MSQSGDWKEKVGQQLQVANQQIVLCQQKIQQQGDCSEKQLCLQNALGGISKAWQEVESHSKSFT